MRPWWGISLANDGCHRHPHLRVGPRVPAPWPTTDTMHPGGAWPPRHWHGVSPHNASSRAVQCKSLNSGVSWW